MVKASIRVVIEEVLRVNIWVLQKLVSRIVK